MLAHRVTLAFILPCVTFWRYSRFTPCVLSSGEFPRRNDVADGIVGDGLVSGQKVSVGEAYGDNNEAVHGVYLAVPESARRDMLLPHKATFDICQEDTTRSVAGECKTAWR